MSNEAENEDEKFDAWDRTTIVSLAVFLSVTVIFFFGFVHWQGLISYPDDKLSDAIKENSYDYFAYALEYRERRLSLALTYRTFITSFGFTSGLVLSTIGGLFVLRRATVDFQTSGGAGQPSADTETARFSLMTNSPGILFMLGGVAIMFITQLLAIPVGSPEIFPQTAAIKCTPDAEELGTCYTDKIVPIPPPTDIQKVLALCDANPEFQNCDALKQLLEQVK